MAHDEVKRCPRSSHDTSSPVAIVTGASSGIGEASARALAAEGYRVVLAARRRDRLDALRAEIEAEGGTALVAETDVTDRDACQALADQTLGAFGRIDVLVFSASRPRGVLVCPL